MQKYLPQKSGAFGQNPEPLIAALAAALARATSERLTPREERQLDELAQRVSNHSSLAAVPVLLEYTKQTQNTAPLDSVLHTLYFMGVALPLPLHLELLRTVRGLSAPLALFLAERWVARAEQERTQAFAEALPLLKAGIADLRAPLEFLALRRRLQDALKGQNFPIPATATHVTNDLPIPAEKEI